MSPPSGACSTDSAGSSLSIDETDCCGHSIEDGVGLTSRFIVPPETQVNISLELYEKSETTRIIIEIPPILGDTRRNF